MFWCMKLLLEKIWPSWKKRHFGAPDKKTSWGMPKKLSSWRSIIFRSVSTLSKRHAMPLHLNAFINLAVKMPSIIWNVSFRTCRNICLQTLSVRPCREKWTALREAQGTDILQTHTKIDLSVNWELLYEFHSYQDLVWWPDISPFGSLV